MDIILGVLEIGTSARDSVFPRKSPWRRGKVSDCQVVSKSYFEHIGLSKISNPQEHVVLISASVLPSPRPGRGRYC